MSDHLTSWNDTPTKQVILDFVTTVTDESNPGYVPPSERIAAFDNDGTLWSEKPMYNQFVFGLETLAAKAAQNPSLRNKQPYKAAFEQDMAWISSYMTSDKVLKFIEMALEAVAGETQNEFDARAAEWLASARHPKFDVPYTHLIYQPMVELLDYLRRHDFRVFICSGGGMDFVRLISEEIYNVPRENVIGSNVRFTWEEQSDGPVLVRQPGLVEPFNDGPGKPINIQLHVGRPPILTGGNSNGDIHMMEFATAGERPFLNLLLHHDDAKREYAYIGGAERALKLAQEHRWTVISMKQDFKVVFPA